MLASYPPFYDEDPMKTYAKIMYGKVKYPKHFSESAESLIAQLLVTKPSRRLGVISTKIHAHPFFEGFDWEDLWNQRMKAPAPWWKRPGAGTR